MLLNFFYNFLWHFLHFYKLFPSPSIFHHLPNPFYIIFQGDQGYWWPSQVPRPSCELGNLTGGDHWPGWPYKLAKFAPSSKLSMTDRPKLVPEMLAHLKSMYLIPENNLLWGDPYHCSHHSCTHQSGKPPQHRVDLRWKEVSSCGSSSSNLLHNSDCTLPNFNFKGIPFKCNFNAKIRLLKVKTMSCHWFLAVTWQLNRWPCHSLTEWLSDWVSHFCFFDINN